MSKKWLNISKTIRQLSISIMLFGGLFYLNNISFGGTLLSIGGLMFALHALIVSFDTIEEEPNWEIVFPELAVLEIVEEEESDKPLKDKL